MSLSFHKFKRTLGQKGCKIEHLLSGSLNTKCYSLLSSAPVRKPFNFNQTFSCSFGARFQPSNQFSIRKIVNRIFVVLNAPPVASIYSEIPCRVRNIKQDARTFRTKTKKCPYCNTSALSPNACPIDAPVRSPGKR